MAATLTEPPVPQARVHVRRSRFRRPPLVEPRMDPPDPAGAGIDRLWLEPVPVEPGPPTDGAGDAGTAGDACAAASASPSPSGST